MRSTGSPLSNTLLLWAVVGARARVLSPSRPSARVQEPPGKCDEERPLRCLMLISDTGGGHRASANALKEAMQVLNPDVQFTITDIWTEYGVWPSTRMARQYQLVARLCGHPQLGFFARMLWRLTFFVSPLAEVPWSEYSHLINGRKFRNCFREYDPCVSRIPTRASHLFEPQTVLDAAGEVSSLQKGAHSNPV